MKKERKTKGIIQYNNSFLVLGLLNDKGEIKRDFFIGRAFFNKLEKAVQLGKEGKEGEIIFEVEN